MVLKADFSHLFKFPFEQVINAYFKKYEGGRDPNVQSIIIEDHWVDDKEQVEYWRRSGQCSNVCPWFLRKFLSDPTVYFTEEMTLDKKEHRLYLHTKNVTFSNYIVLEETSEYRKSDYNPKWTQFIQQGVIDAGGLGTVGSIVEQLAKSFLVKGGSKGITIMEEILTSCIV